MASAATRKTARAVGRPSPRNCDATAGNTRAQPTPNIEPAMKNENGGKASPFMLRNRWQTARWAWHCLAAPLIVRNYRRRADGEQGMSRRTDSKTPQPKDAPAIRARVTLDLPKLKRELTFAAIAADTSNRETVDVILSNPDGSEIRVSLPRAEVKKLLSWRTLLAL
ncbi:MAG: hypothetical protein KIT16_07310 [Rhodospirillaceae bacterium]|nr:hypothetical protein [Rhodospirillaceae bacterium]